MQFCITKFHAEILKELVTQCETKRESFACSEVFLGAGVWLSWLERRVWDAEVPGSNPGTPTLVLK